MKKCLFFFLFISQVVSAQSYFYSLGAGMNWFKGDVQQWNYRPSLGQLAQVGPSVNGEFGVQLNQTFDVRLKLSLGQLIGDPSKNPLPNIPSTASKFSTSLLEAALLADYNFFDFLPPGQTKFNWSPYLTTGLAAFRANPNGIEGVSSLAIPYGVGMKWKLNKKIMIRVEAIARKTFTDRLDLVPVLSPGEQPSNFTLNRTDQYFNFGFSIVYSVYPIICPRLD